ncbi:MAG: porin family protein [Bacteroidota bacterium]
MLRTINTLFRLTGYTVIFLLWGNPLAAQWSIGVGGGLNVAFNNLIFDQSLSEIKQRGNLSGLALSLPIEYPSGRMFSFQSGLIYIQKGTRFNYEETSSGQSFSSKYIIDYLELPLAGKLGLEVKPFRLYVLGGTHIGYALNMKSVRLSNDPDLPFRETRPLDFELTGISRWDISLMIGGGFEAYISEGRRLFVEMRFNAGIKDIDEADDVEVYNESRTFTMGMMIPLPFKRRNLPAAGEQQY